MPTPTSDFSVAVFPFLKTTECLSLGGLVFRSTDDMTGLPAEQQRAVQEIASMLFLQDSLRIKSASFAITPCVDLRYRSVDANDLIDVQVVVAAHSYRTGRRLSASDRVRRRPPTVQWAGEGT